MLTSTLYWCIYLWVGLSLFDICNIMKFQRSLNMAPCWPYELCYKGWISKNWSMHWPGCMGTNKSYVGINMWMMYIDNRIVDFGASLLVVDNLYMIINLQKSRECIFLSWIPYAPIMINNAVYGKERTYFEHPNDWSMMMEINFWRFRNWLLGNNCQLQCYIK